MKYKKIVAMSVLLVSVFSSSISVFAAEPTSDSSVVPTAMAISEVPAISETALESHINHINQLKDNVTTTVQVLEEELANKKTLGDIVLETAYSAIGVKYVRGGTTMNGFDCSGLVDYVYHQVGVELPHYSGAIAGVGTKVTDPVPGDIIYSPGHVAIYVGDGKMIEAPKPGLKVREVPVRGGSYYRVADLSAVYEQ